MSELEPKQADTISEAASMIPQVASTASIADEDIEESQKLSTIRNILLGGQIKQYDSRFTDLEKRFEEIKAKLLDQTQDTLSGLDTQIKSEFESFTTRISEQVKKEFEIYTEKLDIEKKERYASLEKFVSKLDTFENEFKSKFKDIQSQVQTIENTLTNKITEHIQVIKEDMQSEFESLSEAILEKNRQQIQSKIERTELVGFFKDMADRFSL
ncbi:MAG: hypothetical protein HQK75_02855 [Candidatus Magnetomorum sp.]|nr:hypothetical protein [Candidatus Magnetomorum sp.]